MRKGKIPIIFSIIVLLTSPLSGMTELSYAGTTDGLETQPVESKQVLNDKNTSETIEIETDTSKCSSDKIPIENVSEAVASPSEERNKTVINLADLQKYVEFLNEYGMDMDMDWIGLAGWMVLIEDSLSDIKINKKEELGWEKGAKVTIELNYNKGSIDIDNYEFTAPVETSPSMVTANAGLFRGIYLRALIQKYGVALPKDEEQVYSISILSPIEVYSLDKTICYKIYIEGSELLLDIERVKAKYSTDTDSEDADNSLSLLVTLNKKFKYLTAGKNEALWHVSNSDESFQYPLRVPSVLTKVNFSLATPPQLKLHAKENNSLKLNEDVDKLNLSEFVSVSDTMKETVGDESKITYEWLTKPDTKIEGKTKGTVKVTEKYGDYVHEATTDVEFTVKEDALLTAEDVSQEIALGTDIQNLDLNKFVENVKLGEQELEPKEYQIELITPFTSDLVGEQAAKIRVKLNSDTSKFVDIDVPVEINWGNSLRIKGSGFQTISGLSLLNRDNNLIIKATRGTDTDVHNGAEGMLNPKYDEHYLDIELFDHTENGNLSSSPKVTKSFNGTDKISKIEEDIGSVKVNAGDILKISHQEIKTQKKMISVYEENKEKVPYEEYNFPMKESYYEITSTGYETLFFNQLTTTEGNVPIFATDEYLDEHAEDFIDVSQSESLEIQGFSKYPDTETAGEKEAEIKISEMLTSGKKIEYEYKVKLTVVDERTITAEAVSQEVALGTDIQNLDFTKFVKDVRLGDTSLTSDQYTTKLVDTLLTDQVGEQSAKVEVSLKSDPTVKVEAVVPVIIEWGNSLVFKDDFNNGFNFTAASISVLNGPDGPKLMATKGDGFRNSGQVLFYASPDITIYSKSLDTIVKQFSETTTSQEPSDVMTRWNGIFKDLEDNVKYGDIIGVRVDQSYGAHANQNGKNTWVSRENKLVLETEGLDTAFYEITKEGLKLVNLTGSANKQSVQYGIDSTKIDYTSYVKDVKVGDTIVPEEKYIAKLIGDFDTNHLGDTKIKVEVVLKEDPTHKIQIEVPVTVEGELSAEATPQTVPLGTATDSLDLTKFVKNVKLGDTSLTSDQYTTKLVDTLLTDQVGEQSAKVEVSLKSDPTVKVEAVVPVTIEWGNTITAQSEYDSNKSVVSVSQLEEKGKPKLVATKGSGFGSDTVLYSRPVMKIYDNNLEKPIGNLETGTVNKTPADLMNEWNEGLTTVSKDLNYGNIISFTVNKYTSSNTNFNGSNTWVSRNEELTKETEGFPIAYYELTKNGLSLLHINQLRTKEINIPIYTSKEYLDNHINDFIDDSQFETVQIKGFSQYPDTTSSGEKGAKIKVSEELISGKEVEYEYKINLTIEEGTLNLTVPETLNFEDFKLSRNEQIVKRKDIENSELTVNDSRGSGNQGGWHITATVKENEGIGDYLVYRQEGASDQYLKDTVTVYSQDKQEVSEEPINVMLTSLWNEDNGILLKVPGINHLTENTDYQETITWNLVEGP
ncbi:hypothetical protein AAK913_13540 [Enterococcus faecium]|uniref:hypothetical protein n=1 Tax=Enterococcus faecium TaxID=1352 RepID=UPI0035184D50